MELYLRPIEVESGVHLLRMEATKSILNLILFENSKFVVRFENLLTEGMGITGVLIVVECNGGSTLSCIETILLEFEIEGGSTLAY